MSNFEVPDYEEIFGIEPNDAKCHRPASPSSIPSVATTGPANRWMVVARIGDEPKRASLALKVEGDKIYWYRPTQDDIDVTSHVTVFTDSREAHAAMFSARELFHELTVWVAPFTVAE